ncbi:TIGR04282 family arsenosugar biosynthesis glycosyltransferase [Zeaxanthinibacter sp. PT1]|uniref:TIGR04282 family arsenosugar biosynthesis glycosyltransferase n=1 Tax=Zeaxanthinibacter TaxID=561554 RepID=UPI0023495760|nr:TIGR04282 family arsenosugar biosynthesis glycosyltransferase [Zeaxanthinibacter sp. PT1]MDC6351213.1 TIGR04282 family arsenosugar biosynthesis glycosyltransferase [Zeaxanthinibacter sp. PT1]
MIEDRSLLLIFTRNPELGKCKTRLAATIGDEAALNIYKFLLQHTENVTRDLSLTKWVCYSEAINPDDHWDTDYFKKKLQMGNDLGERMENAFRAGFKAGYKHIAIIGSDLYDLSSKDIMNAFELLKNSEAVIGPAKDGGYYLLGMNKIQPAVFKNKDWGTDSVLEATCRDLKSLDITKLEVRNDVDVYDDIAEVPAFQPFLKHIKNDA